MTPDQFTKALNEGTVVGHIGFEQAIAAVGRRAGLAPRQNRCRGRAAHLVSETDRAGEHVTVRPGTIAAVTHQLAASPSAGPSSISNSSSVLSTGRSDQPRRLLPRRGCGTNDRYQFRSRFESFLSTVSVAVNVVAAVVDAPPGLRSMGDLPVRAVASKGANHMSVNGERTSK